VAAVKARPDFAEAAISYARCLLNYPDDVRPADRDFAIAALVRARTRLPYRVDAAEYLAILYATTGDFELADDFVERVLPGLGNPQATGSVRDAVNRIRHQAERETARTAPLGAAVDGKMHGPLPPLPDDPEARDLAQAIARSPHEYGDEWALYNRCAALGNQRNYRDAIRSLGRIVAVSEDEDMKDQAASLLATMKKDAQRLHIPVD
jgi:tetratricopeptide (TPR) repeat protein